MMGDPLLYSSTDLAAESIPLPDAARQQRPARTVVIRRARPYTHFLQLIDHGLVQGQPIPRGLQPGRRQRKLADT